MPNDDDNGTNATRGSGKKRKANPDHVHNYKTLLGKTQKELRDTLVNVRCTCGAGLWNPTVGLTNAAPDA